MAGIVAPLRRTASGDGSASTAARALEGGEVAFVEAEAAMGSTLRTLEAVRSRMLLLETYAQVVVAVEEISERQRDVLQRTRTRYGDLLDSILGP